MLVKVPETPYVRDTKSMALLNTNSAEMEEYLLKSRMMKFQNQELSRINNEMEQLKSDIKDIKSMLLQILTDKE